MHCSSPLIEARRCQDWRAAGAGSLDPEDAPVTTATRPGPRVIMSCLLSARGGVVRGCVVLLGQGSGIGLPKFSSVMSVGSGPPRLLVFSASMAVSSSPVRVKSKTSKFSAIRAGLVDLGMTERR